MKILLFLKILVEDSLMISCVVSPDFSYNTINGKNVINSPSWAFLHSLKKDNCLSVNSTVAADQSTASLPPTKTAKEKKNQCKRLSALPAFVSVPEKINSLSLARPISACRDCNGLLCTSFVDRLCSVDDTSWSWSHNRLVETRCILTSYYSA